MPARNTAVYLQEKHADAKDIEDAREREYTERAKNKTAAMEEHERQVRTPTEEILTLFTGDADASADGRVESPARTNGHAQPAESDERDETEGDDDDE